jgi:hypothetical protein
LEIFILFDTYSVSETGRWVDADRLQAAPQYREQRRKEYPMKKNDNAKRILGRRLAQELSREELEKTAGGGPYATQTLRYPPDRDQNEPIWV